MPSSNASNSSPNASAESFVLSGSQQPQGDARADGFVDRRREGAGGGAAERRQFGSSHDGLSDDGRELALAIDQYKLKHHRRYITCDEMLLVIRSLGYQKL